MILFKDIYNRAIRLFDDPKVLQKYEEDRAGFNKLMFEYLIVAKDKPTLPSAINDELCNYKKPEAVEESSNGDGSNTYVLESSIPNNGVGVDFVYKINGEEVEGEFIPSTGTQPASVVFPREVGENETWVVEWFFAGVFTSDFKNCFRSDFNINKITDQLITILAYALLSTWADEEVGRVLEVRNILTDSDFKIYSPANSAKAKIDWRDKMNENVDTLTSTLNWMIFSTPKGGSRFGK